MKLRLCFFLICLLHYPFYSVNSFAELLGVDDIHSQISLFSKQGESHFREGKFSEALESFEAALLLAHEHGKDSFLLDLSYNRAVILHQLNRFEEGLDQYRYATGLAHKSGNTMMVAGATNGASEILNELGNYSEAVKELHIASQSIEQLDPSGAKSSKLNARIHANLGISFFRMGALRNAQEYLQVAVDLLKAQNSGKGVIFAATYLGNVLLNRGRFDESINAYQDVLYYAEIIGDQNAKANALCNLGIVYQFEGRQDKALDLLLRALKIHRVGGAHLAVAKDHNSLGLVYANQKQWVAAERSFGAALEAFGHLKMPEQEALVLSNLGLIYWKSGQIQKGASYIDESIEIVKTCNCNKEKAIIFERKGRVEFSLKNHKEAKNYFQKALLVSKKIDRPEGVWRAFAGLGDVKKTSGNLKEAVRYYQDSVKTIENLRQNFVEPEYSEAYLFDKVSVFNSLIHGFLQLHSKYDALESVNRRNLWLSKRNSLKESRLLSARVYPESPLNRRLAAEAPSPFTHDRALGYGSGEDRLLYDWLVPKFVDSRRFQQSIPADVGVVVYFLDTTSLWTFSLTSESLRVTQIPLSRKVMEQKVHELRTSFSHPHDTLFDSAFYLFDLLIKPLPPDIARKSALYIVPDDILWSIPFAALAEKTQNGYRYLIQDRAITMANALKELPSFDDEHFFQSKPKVVAFGNPRGYLQASGKEAEFAKRLDPNAKVFVGSAASEANFRRYAPKADILIISSHAKRPSLRGEAFIELFPSDPHDGVLTSAEVAGLDMSGVKLLVLSGCETGLGHAEDRSSFLSLVDSFLLGGARSVLGTLWEVNDETTFNFIRSFLEHYKDSNNQQNALRYAQNSFISRSINDPIIKSSDAITRGRVKIVPISGQTTVYSTNELTHPYFWAPFVLFRHTAFVQQ